MNGRIMMRLLAPAVFLGCGLSAQAQTASGSAEMTFFVTSAGSGKGADLGGLEGADRHCQALASAAGSSRQWRAYLSTQGQGAVNARDRMAVDLGGTQRATSWRRTWTNCMGPKSHEADRPYGKGRNRKGRGDTPNTHDILTGSQADGSAFSGAEDMTCGNWAKSGADGGAMVGHHDRMGLNDEPPAKSWKCLIVPGAAAVRMRCAAPVALVCSTASPPTDPLFRASVSCDRGSNPFSIGSSNPCAALQTRLSRPTSNLRELEQTRRASCLAAANTEAYSGHRKLRMRMRHRQRDQRCSPTRTFTGRPRLTAYRCQGKGRSGLRET